ncbi:imelysin family protein [Salinarimonas rosea]|uniref:imelysin family protein n=1 Tax=Salinarimonas rosea TaxID=552063 RepID=UPI0004035C09|nr:imelysin family protein [Salinarimonas rosea]
MRLFAALAAPLLAAGLAAAAPLAAQPLDPRAAALRAGETVLAPAYDALAEATAAQASAWEAACAAQGPSVDRAPLDAAFHEAADAYARIEPVRTGPVAEDFRFERLAFWPERRNASGRALAQLEALDDEALLAPERFGETSVAGQGFTALERLLFDADTRAALAEGGERAPRLCRIGEAIAGALATTAGEIARAWRDETLPALASDAGEAQRAAARLATDMLSGLEAIETLKLGLPIGADLADARATRAEMWRSGRSARQIALNLEGTEALVRALVDGDETRAPDTLRALAQAERLARSAPADLGEAAADPARRGRVLLLAAAVASARSNAATELPPALDVVTGFNALDGD